MRASGMAPLVVRGLEARVVVSSIRGRARSVGIVDVWRNDGRLQLCDLSPVAIHRQTSRRMFALSNMQPSASRTQPERRKETEDSRPDSKAVRPEPSKRRPRVRRARGRNRWLWPPTAGASQAKRARRTLLQGCMEIFISLSELASFGCNFGHELSQSWPRRFKRRSTAPL